MHCTVSLRIYWSNVLYTKKKSFVFFFGNYPLGFESQANPYLAVPWPSDDKEEIISLPLG